MSCETCARVLAYVDAAAQSAGAENYAFKCPQCGDWITRGDGWRVPAALRTQARASKRFDYRNRTQKRPRI